MQLEKPPMLKRLKGGEKGLSLIELLLVIALTGIIGAVATMSISQVFTSAAISNDQNTAINQVRNAGHWISRDVQMAKTVEPDNGDLTKFLILTWLDPEDETRQHRVIYKLESYRSSGLTKLVREHYYPWYPDNPDASLLESTTLVATNIVPPCDEPADDPACKDKDTWCYPYTKGEVFTVSMTACNDGDYEMRNEEPKQASETNYNKGKETRVFQVKPRPD